MLAINFILGGYAIKGPKGLELFKINVQSSFILVKTVRICDLGLQHTKFADYQIADLQNY